MNIFDGRRTETEPDPQNETLWSRAIAKWDKLEHYTQDFILHTGAAIAISGAAAAVVGFGISAMHGSVDPLDTASKYSQFVSRTYVEAHENFLIGSHSGALMKGMDVPLDITERVEKISTSQYRGKYTRAGDLAVSEFRSLGMHIAMTGEFTTSDLAAYLDYVESLSPTLSEEREAAALHFSEIPGMQRAEDLSRLAINIALIGERFADRDQMNELIPILAEYAFEDTPSYSQVDEMERVLMDSAASIRQAAETDGVISPDEDAVRSAVVVSAMDVLEQAAAAVEKAEEDRPEDETPGY